MISRNLANIQLSLHNFCAQPNNQLLSVFFGLALVHAAAVLILGVNNPILEENAFRQSQTALSIYWLLHGGSLIAYETPVLGYPWSIPFEFPIYQWIVASVALVGVTIEVAGRVISFIFYLGSVLLIKFIFDSIGVSIRHYLVTAILFLCAPLYLYWSRTVMIESCALFFAGLWLLFLIRASNSSDFAALLLSGATLAGVIAVVAKSTTYPAFLVLGGFVILRAAYTAWRTGNLWAKLPLMTGSLAACLIPLMVGFAWVAYSDAVKALNPFGQYLTSRELVWWNFGTWQQRVSWDFWGWAIPRVAVDVLGYSFILGAVVIVYALGKRYYPLIIASCLFAFSIPIIIFTNLHFMHNYYQYANGVFLIVALGLSVACIFESGRYMLGILVLLLLVSGNYARFYKKFGGYLVANYSDDRRLKLAALAREKTQPGESLLGLGFDWSSELVYLSHRKGLMLQNGWPAQLVERALESPQAFLGSYRLGAIAYCEDRLSVYGYQLPLVKKFLAEREILGEVSGCYLVSPSHGKS
jgi:hypothetical protein